MSTFQTIEPSHEIQQLLAVVINIGSSSSNENENQEQNTEIYRIFKSLQNYISTLSEQEPQQKIQNEEKHNLKNETLIINNNMDNNNNNNNIKDNNTIDIEDSKTIAEIFQRLSSFSNASEIMNHCMTPLNQILDRLCHPCNKHRVLLPQTISSSLSVLYSSLARLACSVHIPKPLREASLRVIRLASDRQDSGIISAAQIFEEFSNILSPEDSELRLPILLCLRSLSHRGWLRGVHLIDSVAHGGIQAFEENQDLNESVYYSVEILWNMAENNSSDLLRSEHALSMLTSILSHATDNASRQRDRELRNDILCVMSHVIWESSVSSSPEPLFEAFQIVAPFLERIAPMETEEIQMQRLVLKFCAAIAARIRRLNLTEFEDTQTEGITWSQMVEEITHLMVQVILTRYKSESVQIALTSSSLSTLGLIAQSMPDRIADYSEVAEHIVSYLENGNHDQQTHALEVIAAGSLGNKFCRQLAAAGVVEVLVRQGSQSNQNKIRHASVHALGSLCSERPHHKETIRELDGIRSLVLPLFRTPDSQEVVLGARAVECCILGSEGNEQEFVQAGGVSKLLQELEREEEGWIRPPVLSCLADLLSNCESAQNAFQLYRSPASNRSASSVILSLWSLEDALQHSQEHLPSNEWTPEYSTGTTTFVQDERAKMKGQSSSKGKPLSSGSVPEAVLNASLNMDIRSKIYAVLKQTRFTLSSDATPMEKVKLAVVEQYQELLIDHEWNRIAEELKNEGIEPVELDLEEIEYRQKEAEDRSKMIRQRHSDLIMEFRHRMEKQEGKFYQSWQKLQKSEVDEDRTNRWRRGTQRGRYTITEAKRMKAAMLEESFKSTG